MANEAVIVELMGQPEGVPVSYTCDNATGIEKGTLLWFADPKTVSGASYAIESGKPFAGIAATEKVANDGSTKIGVWTCGIFDLRAVTLINTGQLVSLSGLNFIIASTAADTLSGCYIGRALESANGTAETIQVAVGIY